MSESRKVALIGLGVMGGAIARHIATAGHQLTLYNRTTERSEKWHGRSIPALPGGSPPARPMRRAMAEFVITCVGNDDDLAEVVLGPQGVFSTLRRGGVFIDHTTVSARIARQVAVEARDKQVHCVDAPMTGSQIGAKRAR
jgi:3-hydroxyisobutyrate dehydrogenase